MLFGIMISAAVAAAPPPPPVVASPPPPVPAARGPASPPAQLDRAEFVVALRASPGGPILESIERNFPEDSEAMVDQLFGLAQANPNDFNTAFRQAAAAMEAYVASKRNELFNAPTPSLMTVNSRILEMYHALAREDVTVCARFALGGNVDPLMFPTAVQPQMREVSLAIIEGAGAGRRTPHSPARGTVSTGDTMAWIAEMRALDSDGTILALLMDPSTLTQAPVAVQCRAGTMVHEAIGRLDPEIGAKMVVSLLAQNLSGTSDPAATR